MPLAVVILHGIRSDSEPCETAESWSDISAGDKLRRVKRWMVVAALVGCTHAHSSVSCREDLARKADAVTSCTAAYGDDASVENAKQLVAAYAMRGESAVTALLARFPIGPVGAEIWHHRGLDLRKQVDIDAAIHAFERAFAFRGDDLAGQVRELTALSERYLMRGAERQALTIEARAYETASRLNDPLVLAHVRVALATELETVGDELAAERALADSVDRLTPDDPYLPSALIMQAENDRIHGRTLLARAALERVLALADKDAARDAHRTLIDVALARNELAEASRLLATDPAPVGSGYAWYAARVALAQGHLEEATSWIERAFTDDVSAPFRVALETLRAEILARQGHERDAIAAFIRAMDGVEAGIDDLGLDELKAFAERDLDKRAPFEQLFALYARTGRAADAFGVAQRATGRAYLGGLTDSNVQSKDAAQLAREAGLRVDALHVIAKSLRSSVPVRLPDVKSVVAQLANEIVWTYFVADGHAWLIALDQGDASIDDLGALEELVPKLDAAAALDEGALTQLGVQLAPIARWAHVSTSVVIHIIAGPPFEHIPFAALMIDGHRWIERAAFAYAPSATVLAELERDRRADGSVVVLGDPQGNLPGARAEAVDAARRLHVAPQLGPDATTAVLRAAADAKVLAVGSHANTTPGGAELVLSDGTVTTANIIDDRIAPRLVVLASCASGAAGKDGWGALAGAFLAAGTRNVIASRWALDDVRSREIVEQFYAAHGVENPALALAIAQRDAIARRVPVTEWAAFVSVGTGANKKPEQNEGSASNDR